VGRARQGVHTNASFVVAYQLGFTKAHLLVTEVSPADVVRPTFDAGSKLFGPALSIDGGSYYCLGIETGLIQYPGSGRWSHDQKYGKAINARHDR
jgi:hypothetical protein